jgi:hypothetical protein
MIYGMIKPISTKAFGLGRYWFDHFINPEGLGQYWFDHSINHHIDLIAVQ